MSTISLRMYIREIESMIDQGRMDEAITHCKQILSRFPKHIETYRLLGKTFIENNQNSNAADIFQRVLSAIPDDFVSHVGMSMIREEEGNLISAVEHMERAFEKQPYNNAIQEELRRLYGKRDGIEPPKVRLTQGALARIYLRGNLVNQAIAELRGAIAENPERFDLKTILVEAYIESDQMAKAIDLASEILKKFPYNITANRVLANTLKTHDRPQEMAICKKRLYALSPYEAYISEHAPTLDQVPDRAITLDKIDWNASQQSLRTRTREGLSPWSNSQENEPPKNPLPAEAPLPDWLTNASQEKGNPMSEEMSENPTPGDQEFDGAKNNQEESDAIPEWMKDAGWEPSDGNVDESKPAFEELDEFEEIAGGDELVPAEIPEWLEEAAPTSLIEETEEPVQPAETDTEDLQPAEEDWNLLTASEDSSPEENQSTQEEPTPDLTDEDFFTEESETERTGDTGDIPPWLKDLELDEDSQETAIAWLENMPQDLFEEEEEEKTELESMDPSAPTGDGDEDGLADDQDWMEEFYSAEEDQAARSDQLDAANLIPEEEDEQELFKEEELELPEEELPTWLEELGAEEEIPEEGTPAGPGLPDQEKPEPVIEKPEESDSITDWLSSFEEELQPERPQTEEEDAGVLDAAADSSPESPQEEPSEFDIPDWMGEVEQDLTEQADLEKTPDFSPGADSLAWLESLSADEDDVEDKVSGQREESPPEELPEITTTPGRREEEMGDLPDWLSDLSESISDEEGQETSKQAAPDMPEDIRDEEPSLAAPDDETLNTEIPDWLAGLGDQESPEPFQPDAAEEPDLEADRAQTPDWFDRVEEMPHEHPPSVESETQLPEHLESEEEDDSLSWLEDLQAAVDGSPEVPAEPEDETVSEQPDPTLETQESPDQVSAEEEQIDDMPDWLSELEVQQEPESLKDAIQQIDRPLTEEEKAFLEQSEDQDVSEWLSALEIPPESKAVGDAAPPPEELLSEAVESGEIAAPEEPAVQEQEIDQSASGMLERLRAPQKPEPPDQTAEPEPKVPQWLEDLKKEEDPQETAILWLQEFVKSGKQSNIEEEIKRFTDELNPGDEIPTWMEDLQHEEDPQTTAMLWLEKLETERGGLKEKEPEPDDSGWLAELEKEEEELQKTAPSRDEFFDDDADWLSDLVTDQAEAPEGEEEVVSSAREGKEKPEGDTPPWMKATSPLEGDFFTNELEGGSQEEVEIPEWLAGYTEEELRAQDESADQEAAPDAAPKEEDRGEIDQEYGWFTAGSQSSKPAEQRFDLNQAAISQLESIIGVSYQVAKGIVTFREKHGPYQSLEDLKNVPEIKDLQTIEILKPEIFIRPATPETSTPDQEEVPLADDTAPTKTREAQPTAPAPEGSKAPEPIAEEPASQRLTQARQWIKEGEIDKALSLYEKMLDEKEQLKTVTDDLEKASLDHPIDVMIMKTLGDAYMQQDKLQEALDAYSKAEELLR